MKLLMTSDDPETILSYGILSKMMIEDMYKNYDIHYLSLQRQIGAPMPMRNDKGELLYTSYSASVAAGGFHAAMMKSLNEKSQSACGFGCSSWPTTCLPRRCWAIYPPRKSASSMWRRRRRQPSAFPMEARGCGDSADRRMAGIFSQAWRHARCPYPWPLIPLAA